MKKVGVLRAFKTYRFQNIGKNQIRILCLPSLPFLALVPTKHMLRNKFFSFTQNKFKDGHCVEYLQPTKQRMECEYRKSSIKPPGGGSFNSGHCRRGLIRERAYSKSAMKRIYMTALTVSCLIFCGFKM